MLVTAGASGTTWTVTRGVEGSTKATHSSGANVFHYLTAGALDARYLLGRRVRDTPEAHGALADGTLISCTIVNSTKVLTATAWTPGSSVAAFTAADVGKSIAIQKSGSGGATFVTTIASFTDGTHVVLTAGPGADISSATNACYGTDDTAAFVACFASVVTRGQASGNNAGQVLLSDKIYVLSGAQTKGSPTLGNAQVPLPPIASTGPKFLFDIQGPAYGAGNPHWQQTVPYLSGCVLFSMTSPGADGTNGYPSVIGGPSTNLLGSTDGGFSNMIVRLSGVNLVLPYNPTQIGFDFNCLAGATVPDASVQAFSYPGDLSSNSSGFNGGCIGLRMPLLNNNDTSEVGAYTAYGLTYAGAFADHFNATKLTTVYCQSGWYLNTSASGAQKHGAHIKQMSHEASGNMIDASTGGTAKTFPLIIDAAHVEVSNSGTVEVLDSSNVLTGKANISNTGRAVAKTGGTNFTIFDFYA